MSCFSKHLHSPLQDDDLMVSLAGVGFLDVGTGTPGTKLSDFSSQTFEAWAPVFYQRLRDHADRATTSCGYGTCLKFQRS